MPFIVQSIHLKLQNYILKFCLKQCTVHSQLTVTSHQRPTSYNNQVKFPVWLTTYFPFHYQWLPHSCQRLLYSDLNFNKTLKWSGDFMSSITMRFSTVSMHYVLDRYTILGGNVSSQDFQPIGCFRNKD